MSNPVITAPAMRPRRSMAGAIVLVLLGMLLLFWTTGIIPKLQFLKIMARFWPVLIIVWGIVKLLEYRQAQREGYPPRGIGAGGVFLLILIVILGMGATEASKVNWGALHDEFGPFSDGEFAFCGNTYDYTDELAQAFPAGGSLTVIDDHGTVTVNVGDGDQIKVTSRKRICTENQQTADRYNGQTKPMLNLSGTIVTVNANTQGAGDQKISSDLDITLPRKAAVEITSRHGDVRINGRDGNVRISHQHGDISVEDIEGGASLSVERSSVRAERVSGDVSIEGRSNEVTIGEVKGAVTLNGEFMEGVRLSNIAKSVTFKSSRTSLEFSKLEGELDLNSDDLRATSLTGPLRLATRHKDIRIEGISGETRVDNENGDVDLQLASAGNTQIQNRRADIHVTLPEKGGFQVDARTRNGEIQSDFPELKVETAHDDSTATGAIGAGGARLVISNEHGNIEIRKGSAMASVPVPPTPPATKVPRALPAPKTKPAEPTDN